MPELEALRNNLVTDAQRLPANLQETKQAARDLTKTLEESLDQALTVAAAIASSAQEVQQAEVLPVQFTGFVHNYRYGMVDGTPMHRFDIEVKGTGLWLACTFTSGEFDALLVTAEPAIDLFEPSVIDGQVVTVKRDAKLGRMVPVTFGAVGPNSGSPALLTDKEGRKVRAGDVVSIKASNDSFSRSFQATVIGYNIQTGEVTVQPKNQKSPKNFKVDGLAKFVRVGEDELTVSVDILGQDRDGKDLVLGDLIRLYDEGPGGVVGTLTGKSDTGETFFVSRIDGRLGDNYAIKPASTLKIDRGFLGNSPTGEPLFGGDRIILSPTTIGGYLLRFVSPDTAAVVMDDKSAGGLEDDPTALLVGVANLIKQAQ